MYRASYLCGVNKNVKKKQNYSFTNYSLGRKTEMIAFRTLSVCKLQINRIFPYNNGLKQSGKALAYS